MPLVTFDDRKIDFEIEEGTNKLLVGTILIQWGTAIASNSSTTSVTFGESYGTAPQVYATINGVSRGVDLRTPQISTTSTTGFTFFISARNASSNYYSGSSINWFAIGEK